MPRLTIWIPDRIAHELARLKGKINVSAECRRALEEAIKVETQVISGEATARIVHRLRNSPDPLAGSYELGRRAGQEWSEDVATWDDIKRVAKWGEIAARTQEPRLVGPPGKQVQETVEVLQNGKPIGMTPVGLLNPYKALPGQYWNEPAHFERYFSGVRDAVRRTFLMVKDEMRKT